jgi:hypothetical protein
MNAARLLAVLLVLPGCGAALHADLAPAAELTPPAADQYPDASAVFLLRRLQIHTQVGSKNDFTEYLRHSILQIRSEDGFKYASVKFGLMDKDTLLDFKARVISPDGTEQVLGRDELLETEFSFGEDDGTTKVMALPNVQVGSIVEWIVHSRKERYTTLWTHKPPQYVPVVREEFSISGSKHLIWSARTHNTTAPLKITRGDPWRVSWVAKNLAVRETESFAPPSDEYMPRVEFRVKRLEWGSYKHDLYGSWTGAMGGSARRLYLSDKLVSDLDVKVEPCPGDPTCTAARALALLRETVRYTSTGSFWGARASKEAVAEGRGTAVERAAVLGRLLSDAGLKVRWALANRFLEPAVDRGWPTTRPFDLLLVQLPKQKGLDAPLWLDPACEYCAPGQVRDFQREGTAIIVHAREKFGWKKPEVTAKFALVKAEPPMPSLRRDTYRVSVAPSGDLEVAFERVSEGSMSIRTAINTLTLNDEDWKKRSEKRVSKRSAAGRLLGREPVLCDLAKGACAETMRFVLPGHALADGDTLRVPLDFSPADWVDRLSDEPRTFDLMLRHAEQREVHVHLIVPPGYAVAELPAAIRGSSRAFDAALTARCAQGVVQMARQITTRRGRFTKAGFKETAAPLRLFLSGSDAVVTFRKATPGEDPCGASAAVAQAPPG